MLYLDNSCSTKIRTGLQAAADNLPRADIPTFYREAPSQTLPPDHSPDPVKFSPRSVSRLDEEPEDDWHRTIRPNVLEPPAPRSITHSRESSAEKISPPSAPPLTLTSPRLQTPQSRQGFGGVLERPIDPKSASYGHHRQTSIVHGIQHSRNGSLASSSSSPLSPQMIAAAGAAMLSDRPDFHGMLRIDDDVPLSRPGTSLSNAPTLTSISHVSEKPTSIPESTSYSATSRRVERIQNSKPRHDHSHSHAHHASHSSRHPKDEQKTVGEYALHVLFTSVRPAD